MQPTPASRGHVAASNTGRLLALTMALFFAFGFCTVLVDTLIPKLKGLFALSYAEVMLTQFCFFGAYFIISIPAGILATRIGYLKSITLGLLVMAVGCLMFTPAASMGSYPAFLLALFVLASGVTTVQVAANPLTAGLGDPAKSHSRLTLAQAFNSLATTVGPFFGAAFILAHGVAAPDPHLTSPAVLDAFRRQEARIVQAPFMAIAATLLLLALVCWLARRWTAARAQTQSAGQYWRLLRRPRLALGALSIFFYVGAEVAIGSSIANFLMQPSTLGAPAQTAGGLVSIYWGLAMFGRFIGAVVLRKVTPGTVLMGCALGAAALAVAAALSSGLAAAVAILAIGLCNSIMFPTIFTLAIEDLGEESAQASGLLCLAIVGGAIVPLLTGFAADHLGLGLALFVPAVCYVWIAIYGRLARRGVVDPRRAEAGLGELLG